MVSLKEREKLTNAIWDMMLVKSMIDDALNDDQYHIMKKLISEDRIPIPKNFRQYVRQIFCIKKGNGGRIETPRETNNWLKKNLVENNHEIENLNPQAAMCGDYEGIFNFLIASKSVIKSKHKSLLKEQMRYGYFLHQFCQIHYNEYVLRRRSSSIQTVIGRYFYVLC